MLCETRRFPRKTKKGSVLNFLRVLQSDIFFPVRGSEAISQNFYFPPFLCVAKFFFDEGHKNAKVYFRINQSRVKRRNKKILFSNSCFSVFDESIVLFFSFKKLLLTCSKVLPPKFGLGSYEQNNLN